jgi:general secretion pathway protein G
VKTVIPYDAPLRGRSASPADQRGLTIVEMLVVIAIVGILASAVIPLSRMTVRRGKETELRSGLRTLRTAIDAFHKDCITKKLASDNCTKDHFPESLSVLTQPLKLAGAGDKTRKYLRRIPQDPFGRPGSTADADTWGLRSYSDLPDSSQWGGENVFDVYSKSDGISSDGTKYSSW